MTFFGLADLSLGLNIKVLNGDDRDVLLGIQFFIIWYFTSQDFLVFMFTAMDFKN